MSKTPKAPEARPEAAADVKEARERADYIAMHSFGSTPEAAGEEYDLMYGQAARNLQAEKIAEIMAKADNGGKEPRAKPTPRAADHRSQQLQRASDTADGVDIRRRSR